MGRPAIITKGWDPTTRTWADDTPVGRLLIALRVGNFVNSACGFAGISTSSWSAWRARAAEHHITDSEEPDWDAIPESEHPYVAFRFATDRVICGSEVEIVGVWHRAAVEGDWRAAMNFLARRWPERWGHRSHLTVHHRPKVEAVEGWRELLNDPVIADAVAAMEAAVSGIPGSPHAHAREGN